MKIKHASRLLSELPHERVRSMERNYEGGVLSEGLEESF